MSALVRRVRAGYLIAMLVIAGALIIAGFTMERALVRAATDSRVMNLAGRQRMLSQRVSAAALGLVQSGEAGRWDRVAVLRTALADLVRVQRGLQQGDAALGLPGHPSPELQRLFRAAEPSLRLLVSAAESLQATTDRPSEAAHASAVVAASGAVLRSAEAIAAVYQVDALARMRALRLTQVGLTVAILAAVLLLGWFVVRPAERRIRAAIDDLTANEAALTEANSRLDQALTAAQEAARLKAEFLANMSHEIRTPMNGVLGMTALLLETPLTEEQREYAGTIQSSGNGLLTILNDILDLSKIEAGRLELDLVAFDPRVALEEAIDLLAPQAAAKGLELALLVAPGLPARVHSDPVRLRQVALNLIGNAIKFTSAGGVTIRLAVLPGAGEAVTLRLEVEDTGIGIPASARSRLFQSFSQADGSTTRRFGGTGLGLAISQRLIELLQGEIGYDSVEGRGSRFWCRVPVTVTAPPVRPPLPSRRTLLVVTAEGRTAEALALQARECGADCTAVQDLGAARAWLRATRTEGADLLVLVDHAMGGVDRMTADLPPRARLVRLVKTGLRAGLVDGTPTGTGMLHLPVRLAALRRELDHAAAVPAQARVLVADANAVRRALLARMLRTLGSEVVVAGSGADALERLHASPCATILLDADLIRLEGPALLTALREHGDGPPDAPRLFGVLSSHAPAEASTGLPPLDGLLRYPIVPADLGAALGLGLSAIEPQG
ncbi:MAG: type IV pili methyl-accepting chemotaxis transducer N-terminal domain-containing protein [Gemmatimonadetes bacterium]|nr:type IV pili methyl-accepting chemotaxis transducer N-terminal domain-containing protein [Gemmatimonadota bacterium]